MPDSPSAAPFDAFSADELFRDLFWRWYKPLEREVRGDALVRPDVERLTLSDDGAAPDLTRLSRLPAPAQAVIRRQLERMVDAARQDQAQYMSPSGALDELWLDAFEHRYTVHEAQSLAAMVDPDNQTNDFVVLCCELGAAFGAILQARIPELTWVPEAPYYESYLVNPATRQRINPFSAALRFMSTSRERSLSQLLSGLIAPN